MPTKKILILSIDGLGIRELGAYGNTWIETPSFDRLASRALVFEHVLANSTQVELSLGAMLTGNDLGFVGQPRSVIEAYREQGFRRCFQDARRYFESIPRQALTGGHADADSSDQSTRIGRRRTQNTLHSCKVRRSLPGEHVLGRPPG
jgi:hypothetical protein